MGKYKYKDINTNREIPEGLINGLEAAERIAKKIDGHIPERVVDDGLLTPFEKRNIKYITIPVEKYEDIIRDAGYYQGIAEGLEKQLEELKRPEEITVDEGPYLAIAIENRENEIKDRLKGEIERLEYLKGNGPDTGGGINVAKTRINGKIEGIEYAINLLEEEK